MLLLGHLTESYISDESDIKSNEYKARKQLEKNIVKTEHSVIILGEFHLTTFYKLRLHTIWEIF